MSKKLMSLSKMGSKVVKPATAKHGHTSAALPLGKHATVGVKAELGVPPDMARCHLMLSNPTRASVAIELTGAMLLPQGADTQRLFVASAQDVTETFVTIGAGETRELELETCCMDHSKPGPSGETKYAIGPDVAPSRLVTAGRAYVGWKAMERANKGGIGQENDNDTKAARNPSRVNLEKVQAVCWGEAL